MSNTGSNLCLCSMTSSGEKNGENCISNAEQVKNYSNRFLTGHWTFLGPGSERKWYGISYDVRWERTANKMVQQFTEIGHPICTATSALSRGILKQRKGRSTIHINEEFMNTELIHSVNQASISSAVTLRTKRREPEDAE